MEVRNMTKLYSVRIDSLDWYEPEMFDYECEDITQVLEVLKAKVSNSTGNIETIKHLQIVIKEND